MTEGPPLHIQQVTQWLEKTDTSTLPAIPDPSHPEEEKCEKKSEIKSNKIPATAEKEAVAGSAYMYSCVPYYCQHTHTKKNQIK